MSKDWTHLSVFIKHEKAGYPDNWNLIICLRIHYNQGDRQLITN